MRFNVAIVEGNGVRVVLSVCVAAGFRGYEGYTCLRSGFESLVWM